MQNHINTANPLFSLVHDAAIWVKIGFLIAGLEAKGICDDFWLVWAVSRLWVGWFGDDGEAMSFQSCVLGLSISLQIALIIAITLTLVFIKL